MKIKSSKLFLIIAMLFIAFAFTGNVHSNAPKLNTPGVKISNDTITTDNIIPKIKHPRHHRKFCRRHRRHWRRRHF